MVNLNEIRLFATELLTLQHIFVAHFKWEALSSDGYQGAGALNCTKFGENIGASSPYRKFILDHSVAR